MNHIEKGKASSVALTFVVHQGDRLVSRQSVSEDIVKIGRDPKSHVRLEDAHAARMHAVLEVISASDITLIDLGCDAGTAVNGQRVNKCKLHEGDQIVIGDTTIALERAELRASAPTSNPFTAFGPTVALIQNPFFAEPVPAVVAVLQPGESGEYAMVRSATLNADEVEDATLETVEVKVLWGSNVVHVAHVSPPHSFVVGGGEACDFTLPEQLLGASELPVVISGPGGATLVIAPRARATFTAKGAAPAALPELLASGRARPSVGVFGGYEMDLPSGATARVELDGSEIAFEIAAVRAGKAVPVGFLATMDASAHAYTGLSAFMHLAVVASLAFFLPGMAYDNGEGPDRNQADAMKPYLAAIAEREPERIDSDQAAAGATADREGGSGKRAKDEEGSMGTQLAQARSARWAARGPADNVDPHIARERALQEAAAFGMLGILNAGAQGDPHAPIAPWAREDTLGKDPKSALGNMWGMTIDDAFGMGGLGLTGTGEGGGGKWEGIGMGDVGTIGHGNGTGNGVGFGPGDGGIGHGHGRLPDGRPPHGISMRPAPTTVIGGRLPAEVIQRIVRQNFGRFRLCYENGLRGNPGLSGRVAVKFVIDRNGNVAVAADGGSDMPSQEVIGCVVRGFQNLSFPSPEGGVVSVIYPLLFTPGE